MLDVIDAPNGIAKPTQETMSRDYQLFVLSALVSCTWRKKRNYISSLRSTIQLWTIAAVVLFFEPAGNSLTRNQSSEGDEVKKRRVSKPRLRTLR